MLIVCPSCASEYIIDPARIGADGRTVRCAACRRAFFVPGEPDVTDAELAETEEFNTFLATQLLPEPLEPIAGAATSAHARREASDAEPAASKRRPGSAILGGLAGRLPKLSPGLAAACVLLGLAGGLVAGREAVVRQFPPAARLYAAVRLPVNPSGLEFRGVRSDLVVTGTDRVLVVEGEVRNVARGEVALPALELSVRSPDGQALYTWTSETARKTLAPAQSERFRARLAAPPAEGREVLVRFAERGAGAAVPTSP